jgi:adenylate cyclase
MSYETYALVRDVVAAQEQPPIRVKGINRDVIPYVVDGLLGAAGEVVRIVKLHERGLDLYFDASQIAGEDAARIRKALQDALDALRETP